MSGVLEWVGVAVLGALGALARFRVGDRVSSRRPGAFPRGTFVVNISGSLVLGLLTGISLSSPLMLVFGTGFVGAYTTFSTWMVEAQRLGEDGELALLCAYVFSTMLVGLAAAAIGWIVGAQIG